MKLKTGLGPVTGLDREGYSVFLGVPYAPAPVGERRWRPAGEPAAWGEELSATAFPMAAPQEDLGGMPLYGREFYDDAAYAPGTAEDCLYLNIWRPEGEGPWPVAVWFHGGAFDHGSAFEKEFDGAAYARRGVMLVTAAYRLGALGYLALPDRWEKDGSEGNYGLLDQVAALKWIHRYIGDFGGDPEQVTVFGQSAGAISVELLCSAPGTEGLFRRVILQSGGGMAGQPGFLRTPEEALARSEALVAALGGWKGPWRRTAEPFWRRSGPCPGRRDFPLGPSPAGG